MKNLQRLFVAATVAAVAATGTACKSATPYAAKVNGIVLSRSDLDRELDAIKGNPKYLEALRQQVQVDGTGDNRAALSTQFVAIILNRRILFELVHQEFERRKLKVAERDLERARLELIGSMPQQDEKILDAFPKDYYNEIRRTTAEVIVLQTALADTSEANLRKYYDEHKEQFESVCAAHILVETKAQADQIVKDLAKAKDKTAAFAETAKAKSTDTGSGASGGDLGCAPPAQYVTEFRDAVRTQKIGVIGAPVKSQFGYHIIRVDSREDAKPFAEVEEDVRAAITEGQQGAFTEFIQNAANKAKVEVNPRYGTYDRSGDSPQVVPPKAPDAANKESNE